MKTILLSLLFFCSVAVHASTESPPQKEDSGQTTYEQFCIICHQDGVASAPKFHNEDDWKPRLAGRTLDDLLQSATKGLNLMPEKGTCSECSDDDLKAAIQYMLPKHD